MICALAQVPVCADPTTDSPRSTYEQARTQGFDILPVREANGVIRRVVRVRLLADAQDWRILESADLIAADEIVARDAPVFSLLDRFNHRSLLFALGRHGIDGVVTIYDLNQPAAHLLGFGLALICESEVAVVLREYLGDDPERAVSLVHVVPKTGRGVNMWKKSRETDEDIHISSALNFTEKLRVLEHYQLCGFAHYLGYDEADLLERLKLVRNLRNAIGHYDEAEFVDPRIAVARMQTAEELARRIVERRAQ